MFLILCKIVQIYFALSAFFFFFFFFFIILRALYIYDKMMRGRESVREDDIHKVEANMPLSSL